MTATACAGCLGSRECWICTGSGCRRCGHSGCCHVCAAAHTERRVPQPRTAELDVRLTSSTG